MIEQTELDIYEKISSLQNELIAGKRLVKQYDEQVAKLQASIDNYTEGAYNAQNNVLKTERELETEREKLKKILGVPVCTKCVEQPTGRKFR